MRYPNREGGENFQYAGNFNEMRCPNREGGENLKYAGSRVLQTQIKYYVTHFVKILMVHPTHPHIIYQNASYYNTWKSGPNNKTILVQPYPLLTAKGLGIIVHPCRFNEN